MHQEETDEAHTPVIPDSSSQEDLFSLPGSWQHPMSEAVSSQEPQEGDEDYEAPPPVSGRARAKAYMAQAHSDITSAITSQMTQERPTIAKKAPQKQPKSIIQEGTMEEDDDDDEPSEPEEEPEEEEQPAAPPAKHRGPGMGKGGAKRRRMAGRGSISDDNLSEAPGYSHQRVDIVLAQHQQVVSSLSMAGAKKAAIKAGKQVLLEANAALDKAKKSRKSASPQKQTPGTPLRDRKTAATGKAPHNARKVNPLRKTTGRQKPPMGQQNIKKPHRY